MFRKCGKQASGSPPDACLLWCAQTPWIIPTKRERLCGYVCRLSAALRLAFIFIGACPSENNGGRLSRRLPRKTYYVSGDMKYPEWRAKFVDGGGKSAIIETTMRYKNQTEKILATATPNVGSIVIEPGAKPNTNELNIVNWLHSTLGGDITVLKKIDMDNVKTPDLLWRGGLLEVKHVSGTLGTLDKQVRTGLSQTNNGGVLIDITGAAFSDSEAISAAINRIDRKSGDYIILIRDNNLIAYIVVKTDGYP